MTFEISLLATPKAVPELRHHLRHHDFEVRLCATELVTNVIDHLGEGTPVTIRVNRTAHGHTRVEVTDPDPRALPALLRATSTDESGRGLALLDALTLRWGVDQGADHKTVWCEVWREPREPISPNESDTAGGFGSLAGATGPAGCV
ncbi:ATP-binding protein [Streptomyces sp. NBC_00878]|uniref:ATP-binding protein n=1 Tax=Streptomyces sp. NBC_00878 TaxID=2975854 RepID=UPI00225A38BF|nr:ATP-binding protein [Streptomyces sp. NBC_00878]MCX4905863.1 ATP-binding protein [Streptomyces sp. NBC_00878]